MSNSGTNATLDANTPNLAANLAANIPLENDNSTESTYNQEVPKEHGHPANGTDDDTTIGGNVSFFTKLGHKIDTKLIQNFTPALYVNVMATGICSAILHNFPFPGEWLKTCSYIIWAIGIVFFLSFTTCMVISCLKYPKKFKEIHINPAVSPFMGCIAMGYNSLVNELYFITKTDFIIGIFVLWWISVLLSIYTSFIVFYFTFMSHSTYSKKAGFAIENTFNPTLLLPIVALTVTSSAGQLFALDLPSPNLTLLTIIISYILWAVAMAMSFISITLIFHRYIIHKVPPTATVFTTFIPIGFLGQGAFSILLCGENFHNLITKYSTAVDTYTISGSTTNSSILAACILIGCSLAGVFLIAFGYFNTLIAVASVLKEVITSNPHPELVKPVLPRLGLMKYHKGFWAMTFPLGTMAISNSLLGELFNLLTFKVIGAIYGGVTVIVTIGCLLGCAFHIVRDIMACL